MARWTVLVVCGLLALISLAGAGMFYARRSVQWMLPGRMYATA